MVDESRERLPHILIKDTATANGYTRPARKIESKSKFPQRNRQSHAEQLLNQLASIQENESDVVSQQKAIGLDAGWGIYISFESEPDFDLKFESLEFQRSGIELCSIKQSERKTMATVFPKKDQSI